MGLILRRPRRSLDRRALRAPVAAGGLVLAAALALAAAWPSQARSCVARAFDPNPVATAADPGALGTMAFVADQVRDVALPGRMRLAGGRIADRYVRIEADDGGPYLAGDDCAALRARWTAPAFAFASAYATLAGVADWIAAMERPDALPPALSVRVSETAPESLYDDAARRLVIGSRQCAAALCPCDPALDRCPVSGDGRPVWSDAQDGDVVAHEYAHAILHHLVCAGRQGCMLPAGRFVPMLNEGFADYVAAAYAATRAAQRNDPRCFGEWHAFVTGRAPFCLRHLDRADPWPEAARGLAPGRPYSHATLWTSALLRARGLLPLGAMDRIVIDAYRHLAAGMTPEDMAARLIDTAAVLDGGAHAAPLARVLREAGFHVAAAQPSAAPVGTPTRFPFDLSIDLDRTTAFPAYDARHDIVVPGATGIGIVVERLRAKHGDCTEAMCGRVLITSGDGTIRAILQGRIDTPTVVHVPGDRATIRFVASHDHPRTRVFRMTTVQAWGTTVPGGTR